MEIMPIIFSISIMLFNQAPDIAWGRTFGGTGDDSGYGVVECIDKSFIAVGSTNSSGNGDYNVYVVKVDSTGYPLWSKIFGGTSDDFAYSICPADNGHYLIVGSTNSSGNGLSDIYVLCIDENGDSLWARTYGDSLNETGYSITKTQDNNYVIAGMTNSYGAGGNDIHAIKIDPTGELIWEKAYGENHDDIAYSVSATNDGGSIITGTTYSSGNYSGDIYLLKIDSLGQVMWTTTNHSNENTMAFSVQQTQDSGYIVCGSAYFTLLGYEWCLLKYDQRGSLVWNTFQGSLNHDFAYAVQEVEYKNYIITGNFSYEMYVVRADTQGLNVWMLIYGGAGTDCAHSVRKTTDGGYIIVGLTDSYGAGGNDLFLVKTYPDVTCIKEKTITVQFDIPEWVVCPNPFYNRTTIEYHATKQGCATKMAIYDITGKIVKLFGSLSDNQSRIFWDGTDNDNNILPSGVYYLVISSSKGQFSKKIIKLCSP